VGQDRKGGDRDGHLDDDRADRQEPNFALGLRVHGLPNAEVQGSIRAYRKSFGLQSKRAQRVSGAKAEIKGLNEALLFGVSLNETLLRNDQSAIGSIQAPPPNRVEQERLSYADCEDITLEPVLTPYRSSINI
jgi:hypothetical protein